MRRINLLKKSLVIVLIFSMISSALILKAENLSEGTIYIYNRNDLIQLSKDCSFDLWSFDKTVILANNIDLGNIAFEPIPIFNGIFDGQNHTIKGLYIDKAGSNFGLFRYLGKSGQIKNLNLQGQLEPQGDQSKIGGLVGNNSGLIENCSFSGIVKGKEKIGGLVGWNNVDGRIVNSSSSGLIYGDDIVGGVAGYNGGSIIRARNHASVNTTVEEHKFDLEDFTVENINPLKVFLDATDLGGITGVNTGIILSSGNYGTIGYPHVGYNVGGIAGRQSGFIQESVNYGDIYGRKEIAGIVGQMEPHISQSIEASRLEDLQRELDKLQDKIDSMVGSGKGSLSFLSGDLLDMEEKISASKMHAQTLIDQLEVMLNHDIDEINKISVIGAESLDRLYDMADILEESMEILWKIEEPMKSALDYMAKAMKEMSAMSSQMQVFIAQLEYAIGSIKLVRVELTKAYEAVQDLIDFILDNLGDLKDDTSFGDIDFSDISKALKEILEILDSYLDADKLYDFFKQIERIFEYVGAAFEHIGDAFGVMDGLLYSLRRALGSMEGTSYFTEQAILKIKEAIDILSPLEAKTEALMDKIKDLVAYLRDNLDLKFETTDDAFTENKEDLYASLDDILLSFRNLSTNMDEKGNLIIDDFQGVSDQLFVVFGVLINIVEDLTDTEIKSENFIRDISKEDVENSREGKVSLCENYGKVEGDLNVGGIAGAMAIEIGIDQEKEIEISSISARTVFKRRAILSESKNFGTIIGKKNNVGGIVGNMDLGYLYDCQSFADIESTEGSYVGGIAGVSKSAIETSYARGKLAGNNYIGGIAGLAQEIVASKTMVEILRAKAYFGAIAGQVEANSRIEDNYFLDNGWQGIDGISYGSKAEPLVYEDLIQLEDIPDSFKKFNLKFLVEDELLEIIEFNYGDLLESIEFPEISPKTGYFSYWEDIGEEILTFDREVKGYYVQYLKTLESEDFRQGVLAQILVEGDFLDTDKLLIEEYFDFEDHPAGESKNIKGWKVVIPEDANQDHMIRYLAETKSLKLYQLSQGNWEKIAFKRDGKYIKFNLEGNTIVFSVVERQLSLFTLILASLAIMILLILIVVILVIKKRKTRVLINSNG